MAGCPKIDCLKAPFLANGKEKYLLVGASAIAACFLLYLFGFLFIQTIMLVGYAASFPVILIYERRKRSASSKETINFSEDERWSSAKSELEKVEDRIRRCESAEEKKSLTAQKLSLESNLRKLEWQIKESDLTKLYNASKENVRELPGATKPNRPDNYDGEERDEQFSDRKFLLKLVKEAESVMRNEPFQSLKDALIPVANDLRAHYNNLRRKNEGENTKNTILSNYWVTWWTLNHLIERIQVDSDIAKYTSDDYRPKFQKFLRTVRYLEALHQEEFAFNGRGGGQDADETNTRNRPNQLGVDQ
jgi:hypothetical protein